MILRNGVERSKGVAFREVSEQFPPDSLVEILGGAIAAACI